ncbi:MAG: leucine-rich repeat domain-containing protein [Spirochaetales bacterium]|nr:leucine-rich repeat domain-containing protein [Spirochaetales bacterium]
MKNRVLKGIFVIFLACSAVFVTGCELSGKTGAGGITGPEAEISASDGEYNDRIVVEWDEFLNAAEYIVFRATAENGEYTEIARTADTAWDDLMFVDAVQVLNFHDSYYYQIEAVKTDTSTELTGIDSGFIDNFISIPDDALRLAISLGVPGKSVDDKFYAEDLEPITSLLLPQIDDFTGIEYCINIKTLGFVGGSYDSLEVLLDFPALSSFILESTTVADVGALASTPTAFLKIEYCTFADFSVLPAMPGLQSLELFESPLDDCTSIAQCVSLQSLSLSGCGTIDLTPLAAHGSLRNLKLYYCTLAGLDLLSDFPSLVSIEIRECGITGVSGFNNCPVLQTVDVADNQIASVTGFQNCPALRRMLVYNNDLPGLEWLLAIQGIEEVFCQHNRITTLINLSSLVHLQLLQLDSNAITEIAAFDHASLQELHLYDNAITNLDSFGNLPSLAFLDVSGNVLTSLDGLEGMASLYYLVARYNTLSDITGLADLLPVSVLVVTYNNMDVRMGSANYEIIQQNRALGGDSDYIAGNITDESAKTELTSVIRSVFSNTFGGYYSSFSYTDATFEYDTVINYVAYAEYSGAIVGPTHELVYAGIVSCNDESWDYTIEEFIANASALPLIDQIFTPDPGLSYTSEFVTLGDKTVWRESAVVSSQSRRFYIFKHEPFFVIVSYYCSPKGLTVLESDVESAVTEILNNLPEE